MASNVKGFATSVNGNVSDGMHGLDDEGFRSFTLKLWTGDVETITGADVADALAMYYGDLTSTGRTEDGTWWVTTGEVTYVVNAHGADVATVRATEPTTVVATETTDMVRVQITENGTGATYVAFFDTRTIVSPLKTTFMIGDMLTRYEILTDDITVTVKRVA